MANRAGRNVLKRRRIKGRETTLCMELEREELAPQIRLYADRLSSLCTPEEFVLVEAVMQEYVVVLMRLYRASVCTIKTKN